MEYELTNIIYDNSEYELEIEIENIEIQDFSLEELTVLPSSEQQIITPTQPKTYYNKVIVEPITTENIEVISSNIDKIVTPTTGKFINEVTVKGDTNLVSENIKSGVNILGVDGSLDTKYSPRFISFYGYKGTDLSEELSNLNTSNITNMSYMFSQCNKLIKADISNFNTSNVIEMIRMFDDCRALEDVNFDNLDFTNVESVAYMFSFCQNLKNVSLKVINANNIKNFSYMFIQCNNIESLDLSNFNIANANNISWMFSDMYKLTSIDLSGFKTASPINTSYMFRSCKIIPKIDISTLNSDNSTGMFYGCSNLTTLIIDNPNLFEMTNLNMLQKTPIANGTGYVYVPDNMVETYKSATNWNVYANQIKGMSELPSEV